MGQGREVPCPGVWTQQERGCACMQQQESREQRGVRQPQGRCLDEAGDTIAAQLGTTHNASSAPATPRQRRWPGCRRQSDTCSGDSTSGQRQHIGPAGRQPTDDGPSALAEPNQQQVSTATAGSLVQQRAATDRTATYRTVPHANAFASLHHSPHHRHRLLQCWQVTQLQRHDVLPKGLVLNCRGGEGGAQLIGLLTLGWKDGQAGRCW